MRRFIECLTTNTNCNLKCSYCYLIQQNRRTNKNATFNYSPEHIGKALSIKRLGGVSLISITASGETFIPKEIPLIAKEILKQGHFLNITTNGTLTKQINHFLSETEGFHDHIHISFSFHYVELKKRDLINVFFHNIKTIRDAGCSILLQINLVDEYLPYWNEIKELSLKYVGALPQVALTRREIDNGKFEIFSDLPVEIYKQKGEEMQSPLFDFTVRNFNVKRNEFCYAGWWSATLNMDTGELTGCYGLGKKQNIFIDLNKKIVFSPIGRNCTHRYCFNSSHFISQGIIPSLLPLPSYGELRNREQAHWYTDVMKDFLYQQFEQVNENLPICIKTKYYIDQFVDNIKNTTCWQFIRSIKYKLWK